MQLIFGPRAVDGLTMVYSEDEEGNDDVYLMVGGEVVSEEPADERS
jgi:hypothetical protein